MPRETPTRAAVVSDGAVDPKALAPDAIDLTPPPLDDNDVPRRPQRQDDPEPSAPQPSADGADDGEPRATPHSSRLEQIATARKEQQRDEYDESQAAISSNEPAPPPAADPAETLTLKVRGQDYAMTRQQRDDYVRGIVGDIDNMSEADRDSIARREIAYHSYERDLEAQRAALRQQQQPAPAQQQPPEQQPQPQQRQPEVDPITEAIRLIQEGGDPVEVRAALVEQFGEIARQQFDQANVEQTYEQREHFIERNLSEGYEAVEKELPVFRENRLARNFLNTVYGDMQREVIRDYLARDLDDNGRAAFAQGGLSNETLDSLDHATIDQAYRTMLREGYRLLPPGDVVKASAVSILQSGIVPGGPPQQPGAGQPPGPSVVRQQQPATVDRSDRKHGLVQPQRVALPRNPNPTVRVPPSDAQRRNSALEELRAGRGR